MTLAIQPAAKKASGHFGEWIQGPVGNGGEGGYRSRPGEPSVTTALLTCFARKFLARAEIVPNDSGDLTVSPAYCRKALAAARRTFELFGVTSPSAEIRLIDNFPQDSVGWGLGSSSAHVSAAIRAAAAACGEDMEPVDLAKLAFEIEGATDSIAFENRAVLFGSRVGRVFEDLTAPVPPATIIGVNLDPKKKVETSGVKFDYPGWYVDNFAEMIRSMRRAIERRDLALLAQAATDSAGWNQEWNKTPFFYPVHKVFLQHGALGVLVAHTGSVMGGIFPRPGDDNFFRMGGMVEQLVAESLKSELPVSDHQLFRIDTGDDPGLLYSISLKGLEDL